MSEKLPAPREGLSGKAMRRVVMGSFAGALMEWYDFFIFGTAAGLVFAPPVSYTHLTLPTIA